MFLTLSFLFSFFVDPMESHSVGTKKCLIMALKRGILSKKTMSYGVYITTEDKFDRVNIAQI